MTQIPMVAAHELSALLSRLHVLVIGPGLGREDYMQDFARLALDIAKEQGMFLVLDADGLYMAGHQLDLVRGYRRAVLTPNVVEFKRLSEQAVCVASYTPFEKIR
jgi:ATP-dependent NAD(P)H-hydrate dehydratase